MKVKVFLCVCVFYWGRGGASDNAGEINYNLKNILEKFSEIKFSFENQNCRKPLRCKELLFEYMKNSCEHLQVKGCQILLQHHSLDALTGNFQ